MIAAEPLLLTACIDPGNTPFVKRAAVNTRLADYLHSLERWIGESDFSRIVFCENSGYAYDYAPIIRRAKDAGKTLEVLVFEGNKESALRGKGYGEGEIIAHAFEHSSYLAQASSFYKITGRLFVANINQLLRDNLDVPTIAQRYYWSYRAVDTRFFKVSSSLFRDVLLEAYREVNDAEGHCLEYVYWERLKRLRLPVFSRFPDIVGMSATNNEAYTLSRSRLSFNNLAMKLGYFNVHEPLLLRSKTVVRALRGLKSAVRRGR